MVRRDTCEKAVVKESKISAEVEKTLKDIQSSMFKKAGQFLKANSTEAKTWPEFKKAINERKLVLSWFCDRPECEEAIKDETTATSRCIPFGQKKGNNKCIKCGQKAETKAWFGKSY